MASATYSISRVKTGANGIKKFYVSLNLEGKKTERFGGYSEKEANKKGAELIVEYNKDPEAFFNKSQLKGAGFEGMVEEFCNRPVGAKTNDLNRSHLEAFVADMKITGIEQINKFKLKQHKHNMLKAELSNGTIRMRLRAVRTFVLFCLDKKYLKSDPWPKRHEQQSQEGPLMPKYRSSGYFYSDSELLLLTTLPEKCTESELDLVRTIKLALFQGWRESIVWGFCWERMDLDRGIYLVPGMKGAPEKEVPLNPETIKLVAGLGAPQERGRIFTRWGDPKALSHRFLAWRREVGVSRGRFHDLKHTCVSKLMAEGYTDKQIEELTNTSVAALQHYKHADRMKTTARFQSFNPLAQPVPVEQKRQQII